MKWLALALLVACGPGPGEQHTRGEGGLEAYVERMCNCHDAGCAQLVIKEMAQWSKRIADTAPKPDPAVTAEAMGRFNACMKRALGK